MRLKKETKKMLNERKIVQELLAGKSNREISREFKICQKRVSRFRKLAATYGYLDNSTPLPLYPEHPFPNEVKMMVGIGKRDDQILPHMNWIKERLNLGWHKITIHEELPIKVSRSSFYRFMRRHNLFSLHEVKENRVVPEIFHQPGEALLLDWGLLRTVVDPETGKRKKLWAFVGVLGYSRLMTVRLVWKCDTKTTINSLENMFQEIGGVPLRLTTDNPKCFSLEASKYEPLFNPVFERFSEHYGFKIECLPPRDPQKKGKVERLMPFVRRLCESYVEFISIEHMQDFLNKKVEIANDRKHGTILRKPFETFIQEEVNYLKSLPPLSYEIEEYSEGKGRQDGYVRFHGKYYSIGCEFSGKDILIIANQSRVSFYYKGKLIETHPRICQESKYKSTKSYHLKSWEQVSFDHENYLERAKKIGPHCVEIVSILLSLGNGFIDTRIVWGILSLDKQYSHVEINEACGKAVLLKSYSYRTVKSLLLNPIQNPPETTRKQMVLKEKKHSFVRDLSEYQKILL
jgi:hypothetical protein